MSLATNSNTSLSASQNINNGTETSESTSPTSSTSPIAAVAIQCINESVAGTDSDNKSEFALKEIIGIRKELASLSTKQDIDSLTKADSLFISSKSQPDIMERVPAEIIMQIFVWLTLRDLLKCAGVCKTWRLVANEPFFLNFYRDNNTVHLPLKALEKVFSQKDTNLNSFNLLINDNFRRIKLKSIELEKILKKQGLTYSLSSLPPEKLITDIQKISIQLLPSHLCEVDEKKQIADKLFFFLIAWYEDLSFFEQVFNEQSIDSPIFPSEQPMIPSKAQQHVSKICNQLFGTHWYLYLALNESTYFNSGTYRIQKILENLLLLSAKNDRSDLFYKLFKLANDIHMSVHSTSESFRSMVYNHAYIPACINSQHNMLKCFINEFNLLHPDNAKNLNEGFALAEKATNAWACAYLFSVVKEDKSFYEYDSIAGESVDTLFRLYRFHTQNKLNKTFNLAVKNRDIEALKLLLSLTPQKKPSSEILRKAIEECSKDESSKEFLDLLNQFNKPEAKAALTKRL